VSSYAQAQLSWSSALINRQIVSSSALFTTTSPTPPPNPPPPTPTATVVASADTYVQGRDFADVNYGDDLDIRVKGATDTQYVRESYIRFDLSGVDAINSATLSLSGKLNSSDPLTVGIFSSTDTPAWDQSTLTWNTKFLADPNPLTTFKCSRNGSNAFIVGPNSKFAPVAFGVHMNGRGLLSHAPTMPFGV